MMTAELEGQTDLLALLADIEAPAGDVFHIVQPNMAYVCGKTLLGEPRRLHRMAFEGNPKVNCPDCLAVPAEERIEQARQMQQRQA